MKRVEKIRSYYKSNMAKDMEEYELLGWESEETQKKRFEVFKQNVNLKGKKLLDVGCGTGNLLEYLVDQDILIDYVGVDIMEDMISIANEKKMNVSFHCVDIFKERFFEEGSFDAVYTSGIFNLNLGNNLEFLLFALNHLLDLTRETVTFNLLHSDSQNKEDIYYYYSPDQITTMLKKIPHKIRKFDILQNYLQNDFTVVCFK